MFTKMVKHLLEKLSPELPLNLEVCHTLFDGGIQTVGRSSAKKVRLKILHPSVYRKLILSPSVGFAESYAAGEIEVSGDSPALFHLFKALFATQSLRENIVSRGLKKMANIYQRHASGTSLIQSQKNVEHHYDTGDRIIKKIVGRSGVYTCALYPDLGVNLQTKYSLDEAQALKIRYSFHKLQPRINTRLLDIGCGYGAFLVHGAIHYRMHCTGTTLSAEQAETATQSIEKIRLSHRCKIELWDYREIQGLYNYIICLGMFEHVGAANWQTFFAKVAGSLASNGRVLIHCIGRRISGPGNQFVRKHIFPGVYVPTADEVIRSAHSAGLRLMHLENWKLNYARTLLDWYHNLLHNEAAITGEFGDWQKRIFEVYLTAIAASFTAEYELYQFLFTNSREDSINHLIPQFDLR